jgi:hypothetical protein
MRSIPSLTHHKAKQVDLTVYVLSTTEGQRLDVDEDLEIGCGGDAKCGVVQQAFSATS